ncbi:MAG: ABC transporter substrate-binding protein [Rhodospirillales bacterium]
MTLKRLALVVLLVGFGAGGAEADRTAYPLALENCGRSLQFEVAPERVVSVGQSASELLFALGLADRVVGTAVWFTEVLPQYQAVNDGIERLADNDPSFESILAKRPQLVIAQYEWHIGPQGSVATREQFADLGIASYILPADCVGKDNSGGGDGTRVTAFSMDSIYRAIRELGAIFDVKERGAALISDMEARQRAAVDRAAQLRDQDLSAVVWFSSPDKDSDAYVAGQKGVPGFMLKALGIRNVVESDEEWPLVGWETIARANPDVIVIARMDRRRFPLDDYRAKLEFLRDDPVTGKLDAVVQDRIVIVDAQALEPSTRITGGLEAIAAGLEELGLTQ